MHIYNIHHYICRYRIIVRCAILESKTVIGILKGLIKRQSVIPEYCMHKDPQKNPFST